MFIKTEEVQVCEDKEIIWRRLKTQTLIPGLKTPIGLQHCDSGLQGLKHEPLSGSDLLFDKATVLIYFVQGSKVRTLYWYKRQRFYLTGWTLLCIGLHVPLVHVLALLEHSYFLLQTKTSFSG